jgi:hypothetical protein
MTSREISNEVEKQIKDYLEGKRISYIIHGEHTDDTINYEMFVGSQTCWVQIERDDNDDDIVIQLYDTPENPSFEEIIKLNTEQIDSLVDYLDELIEHVKGKIKAEAKIESLIQKIIDTCNDYQLKVGDYIEITNYDMDFEGLD